MENVECIFNSIKLHEHQQDEKCYFDPIRYFLVQKTPEEEVRQKNNYIFTKETWYTD